MIFLFTWFPVNLLLLCIYLKLFYFTFPHIYERHLKTTDMTSNEVTFDFFDGELVQKYKCRYEHESMC